MLHKHENSCWNILSTNCFAKFWNSYELDGIKYDNVPEIIRYNDILISLKNLNPDVILLAITINK